MYSLPGTTSNAGYCTKYGWYTVCSTKYNLHNGTGYLLVVPYGYIPVPGSVVHVLVSHTRYEYSTIQNISTRYCTGYMVTCRVLYGTGTVPGNRYK